MNILVTAVGGDLGQSIVKSLRLSSSHVICHGCDADASSIGSLFVDSFAGVPSAIQAPDRYISSINELCASLHIEVIIPASEPEIDLLSSVGTLPCGTLVITQPSSWIMTYGDKLTCMAALEGKVNLARFADGTDQTAVDNLVSEVGYPLVVKARRSSGSQNISIATTDSELTQALGATPNPLVQAFIDGSQGEFSAAVFVCESFEATILFQRGIGPGGGSWWAETSNDSDVLEYVRSVTKASLPTGAFNVQVRKSQKGTALLEINPRFSSLVAARSLCGFKDVEWTIDLAMGTVPSPPTLPFRSLRFQRFLSEAVDFGDGFKTIPQWATVPESSHPKIS